MAEKTAAKPKGVIENPPHPAEQKKPKVSRPYKTPSDLYRKMRDYFAECETDPDWRQVVTGFAEIARKAEEAGTWNGLQKEYQDLADRIVNSACFPDEAGMRIHLDLSHESYRSYQEDPDYQKVFDWAQDMRESWAARRLAADPKSAQAFLNILKQGANGGWVDRKTDTGDKSLTLKVAGVGGMEAFQ